MNGFREIMEENSLYDLNWKGDKYTGSNKHENQTFTKERLDWALVNSSWTMKFHNVRVDTLAGGCQMFKPQANPIGHRRG